MTRVRHFLNHQAGAGAAEFALILPVAILFLLGLIDVGRYTWAFNQAEKATQIGARLAVVSNPVPAGMKNYSFATTGLVPQGQPVPETLVPNMVCTSTGQAVTCTGSANLVGTPDAATFNAIAARMNRIWSRVNARNVEITYSWAGLGYSGDPNGPDVQPLITVRLRNPDGTAFRYPLWFLIGATVPLPDARYSLTAEDMRTQ